MNFDLSWFLVDVLGLLLIAQSNFRGVTWHEVLWTLFETAHTSILEKIAPFFIKDVNLGTSFMRSWTRYQDTIPYICGGSVVFGFCSFCRRRTRGCDFLFPAVVEILQASLLKSLWVLLNEKYWGCLKKSQVVCLQVSNHSVPGAWSAKVIYVTTRSISMYFTMFWAISSKNVVEGSCLNFSSFPFSLIGHVLLSNARLLHRRSDRNKSIFRTKSGLPGYLLPALNVTFMHSR